MKCLFSLYLLLFCFHGQKIIAQSIPSVSLENDKGKKVNSSLFNDTSGKPVIIAFWATWCIPCINELSVISENYESWKKKYQFDFYGVAQDDSRTIKRVKPLVSGKNWEFKLLFDKNQELRRVLNIPNVPYTIIVKNGKIVYRHSGYVVGDEDLLLNEIKLNQN